MFETTGATSQSAGSAIAAARARSRRWLPDIANCLSAALGKTAGKSQSRRRPAPFALNGAAFDIVQTHNIPYRCDKARWWAAGAGFHTAPGFHNQTVVETKSIKHALA